MCSYSQVEINLDDIENNPRKMLHSLNSLRVIFELIIVSSHVSDFGNKNIFIHSYGTTNCLMSFFFVLSGFVSMYTTDGKDTTYFMRRLKKTYPFYILMWLSGLPIVIYGNIFMNKCSVHSWIYLFLQPLCFEIFLGWEVEGSNVPAWYYTVLVILWFIHSYFDLKYWIYDHPLKFMVLFYVFSVMLSIPFFYFDRESVKQLPFFRILEFFMGSAVAISFKKGYIMSGKIAYFCFVIYIIFAVFTAAKPKIWADSVQNGTCIFWKQDDKFWFKPNGLITITSLIWAIIIHWLACFESSGGSNLVMNVLEFDFFKNLSKFSLQLYLSHWVTTTYFYHILRELGILNWFSKDFHMIFAYSASYWLYVYVQPKLDSWVQKLTSKP